MTEFPDGVRRVLPGQTVDLEPNFCQPFYYSMTLVINASNTGTGTLNFTDPDYLYYIDEIHISPGAFTEFAASSHINDIPFNVGCSCGYLMFAPRNNPSIVFVDGDNLKVLVTNLDASQRTFTVRINGTKILRTDNYGRPPYATFSLSPVSGVVPLTVQFTDESGYTPISWDWDFGDGSPHSTEQNPSHEYTLEGTYTVTLIATNAFGFDTYVYASVVVAGTTANLLTFTEVDPNNHLTVSASKVEFAAIRNNEDAYVYKDFGTGHFTDIDVLFSAKITAESSGCSVYLLAFTNALDDVRNASGYKLTVRYLYSTTGTHTIRLNLYNGTTAIVTDYYAVSLNTEYYFRLEHVAGASVATLKIYSDAARTDLLDTLQISSSYLNRSYRYCFVVSSANSGDSYTTSGYVDGVSGIT